MNGSALRANRSPVCATSSARKTTIVSPFVCPGPKWYRSIASSPSKSVRRSWYVSLGRNRSLPPANTSEPVMLSRAFSCATTRTTSWKSGLLPTWSPCACVLMIVVTGSSVSACTVWRIDAPQPGFLVSTSTTPLFCEMSSAVWPPPPLTRYRFSATPIDCTATRRSSCCSTPAAARPAAPATSSAPMTIVRRITASPSPAGRISARGCRGPIRPRTGCRRNRWRGDGCPGTGRGRSPRCRTRRVSRASRARR